MKKLILLAFAFPFIVGWMSPSFVGTNPSDSGTGTISYVGSATNAVNSSTTIQVTPHASSAVGDMMIAYFGCDTSASLSATGWTSLGEVDNGGMTTELYYREFQSGDNSAQTFTSDTSNNLTAAIITIEKTGGTWETPDGTGLSSNVSNSLAADVDTGSVTATTGSTLVVMSVHDDGDPSVRTPPSGMTEAFGVEQSPNGYLSHVGYYQETMTSGAVTKNIDWSVTDYIHAGAAIVGLQ